MVPFSFTYSSYNKNNEIQIKMKFIPQKLSPLQLEPNTLYKQTPLSIAWNLALNPSKFSRLEKLGKSLETAQA